MYLMDLYRERAEKYRTPSIEHSEKYQEFEAVFPFEPTPDQAQCFQVRQVFVSLCFGQVLDDLDMHRILLETWSM